MAIGHSFTTLDNVELEKLGGSCREYTFLRYDPLSKVEGWIRGNTKIGPALEVAVTHNQGRYGIEIMIQLIWRWNSFLGDDREWIQQIRDGDDGGNRRRPHRLH